MDVYPAAKTFPGKVRRRSLGCPGFPVEVSYAASRKSGYARDDKGKGDASIRAPSVQQLTCRRQVEGAMNIAKVDLGDVSVTNELSSRPERSVVERSGATAVRSTSIQLPRRPLLFIRNSLTCQRQVSSGMNKVCEVVITTITPNGSATLPSVIPSSQLACGKLRDK
jgi:hypothetical protein